VGAATIGAGIGVRPNLLVGVELLADGWRGRDAQQVVRTDVLTTNVSLAAYWFPIRRSGLFLKAGNSLAVLVTDEKTGSLAGRRYTLGLGFVGGIGYDIRLSRGLAITAQVSGRNARVANRDGLYGTSGWNEWSTLGTLGITIR
jgi:hypothetical protein